MIRTNIILIALFSLCLQYGTANAAIDFVNATASFRDAAEPFTSFNFSTAGGDEGDFDILTCVTQSTGPNSFTGAQPDWENFNLGGCGGAPNCILGIFTRFLQNPENTISQCDWTEPINQATSSIFRLRGVNTNAPIFDISCNTGIGNIATAPSVAALDGSYIVRTYGANSNFDESVPLPGSSEFGRTFMRSGALSVFTYGEPFPNQGRTQAVSIQYELVDAAWRACTMSVTMEGVSLVRNIPTMSEWGMIAFVVIAGVAAVLVLRRRSAA